MRYKKVSVLKEKKEKIYVLVYKNCKIVRMV